ncbi:monocyte to macrophage differentiation factor 2 isoform X2 [Achroia grisella]|uniref:monocyte to macrophage differentiation factor 2 isoform X2 n=1 Tax=Achroia grisella TaxID=688607 RepID=UPI0027D2BF51|nr:monocyte to macrophage differentiation factor 2 isoform X2 [Achroia grisella]
MGDVVSLFSVIIMKFKSKFNENKIYFHCDLPWKKLNAVKWMNERASSNRAYVPTAVENVANVCTHALCVAPASIGARVLLTRSVNAPQAIAAVVYGLALCLLFAVSTTFHSVCCCKSDTKMKHFLHRCDRAMIYIFIASSYFPWLTVGTLSCWMLRELRWAIWLLAVLGITYQQIFHERFKMLELLLYLVMGLGPAAIILTSNCMNTCDRRRFSGASHKFNVPCVLERNRIKLSG